MTVVSAIKSCIRINDSPQPSPSNIRLAKYILGNNDFIDIPGRGRVGAVELAQIIAEGVEADYDNLDDY